MKSFSLALLTASALAATNYGFQCQEAHVYDKRTSNSINCRLSTKPAQPVQVTLESKDLKFKECLITLKDTAWVNIPVIAPMSCEADAKTKFNITATLSSNCANPQPPLPIEVTRHSSKCIFGSSTGDPHYALTNGVPRVTFHAPSDGSEYDLFMSDQLQVQTRIGTCADGKATCNNAITVRYGSSILVFDLKDKTPGIKTVTKNDGSIVYSPPKVTGKNGDKVDHTFTFPCGSIVKFNTFGEKNSYMNVMAYIAPSYSDYGGMLNRADMPAGSFLKRGKQVIKNEGAFFQSWAVTGLDRLRYKKTFQKPANFIEFPKSECGKPAVCVPNQVSTTAAPTTTAESESTYVPDDETTTVITYITTTTTELAAGEFATTTTEYIKEFTTVGGNGEATTVKEFTTVGGNGQATTAAEFTTVGGNGQATTVAEYTTVGGNGQATTVAEFTTVGGNGQATTLAEYTTVGATIPKTTTAAANQATFTNPPAVTTARTVDGFATTTIISTVYVPAGGPTTTAASGAQQTYTAPPSAPFNDLVTQQCSVFHSIQACHQVVSVQGAIQACEIDCRLTGNFGMLDSHVQSYMAICNTYTLVMESSPNPAIVQQAQAIRNATGLGENSCLNSCSGHGKCTSIGCSCDAGYAGVDCSTNLAPLLSYNPAVNAYVTNNPAATFYPANPLVAAAPASAPAPAPESNPAPGPQEGVNPVTGGTEEIYSAASTSGYTLVFAVVGTLVMIL